jgi:hypothetical protein
MTSLGAILYISPESFCIQVNSHVLHFELEDSRSDIPYIPLFSDIAMM